jgi:ABC-type Mn2+/Zn2+ transport system permease subunit
MSWLIDPFKYGFMQSAALAGVLVGITCASLGVFVVLRRMAFIGDAMSHAILPGLVISYLQRFNLFAGALIAGVATAIGIGWLSRRRDVREDSAIGILFTGMFALGVLLISTVKSYADFSHMLFGYILGVTDSQLVFFALIALVVIGVLILLHKELELTSFDPLHAQAIGLSADRMRYVLLVLMALAVIGATQAVGVVLTNALLIIPAATAALLTQRLLPMTLISCAVAVVSSLAGLLVSYHLNVASGAAIVLVTIVCFAAAWVWSRVRR